jgi:antitoxin HicB
MKQDELDDLAEYPFCIHPKTIEEGGGYRIEFPDVPGCMSDGATHHDAITNGRDSLRSALTRLQESGEPIPQPGCPASTGAQWRQRAPKSLHSRLVARARQEGVSLNTLVITMIAEGLGKRYT